MIVKDFLLSTNHAQEGLFWSALLSGLLIGIFALSLAANATERISSKLLAVYLMLSISIALMLRATKIQLELQHQWWQVLVWVNLIVAISLTLISAWTAEIRAETAKKKEAFRKADELEKMNAEEAAIFMKEVQTARGTGKRFIIREIPKKDT